jgi:hypothetical protein
LASSIPERKSRPIWILPAIAAAFYIFGAFAYLLIDGAVGCQGSACISAVKSTLASGTVLPASTPSGAVSIVIGFVEGWGIDYLFLGAILLVVASTGFRQGLSWSYYVLFLFFLYGIVGVVSGVDTAPWNYADVVLVGVGLTLSYRRFFGSARSLPVDPTRAPQTRVLEETRNR